MKTAEWGSYIKIKFSISLEDGSIVGNPEEPTEINFKIGDGKIFPAFESNIVGMKEKEIKKIHIPAADAYGEYNKEIVLKLGRDNFPPDIDLIVGRTVQYQNRDGERVNFIVNALDEQTVTVDGNHPLAGLHLIYEVELLEIP